MCPRSLHLHTRIPCAAPSWNRPQLARAPDRQYNENSTICLSHNVEEDCEAPTADHPGGQVVGFASLRLVNYLGEDAPYAEMSELFVSASYRRQGIARALIAELEVRARAAGASSMAVLTAPDNDAALSLYRAMGFQEFSIALQKWFTEDRPYRVNRE